MGTINFVIVQVPNENEEEDIFRSTLLLEVFKRLRTIKDLEQYQVEQYNDDDYEDGCNAKWLVENYTEENLPYTISQIHPDTF